jgi:hypothetical protein
MIDSTVKTKKQDMNLGIKFDVRQIENEELAQKAIEINKASEDLRNLYKQYDLMNN